MDASTVYNNIRALSAHFATERAERQQRRELFAADFARLQEAGCAAKLLRDYVPTDREPQTRPFAGLKNANAVLPTYYFSEAPNTAYVDL